MCREYTIGNCCGHFRTETRYCHTTSPCYSPTKAEVDVRHLCQECSTSPLAHTSSRLFSRFSDVKVNLLKAKAGIEETCIRASLLVEGHVPSPEGKGGPFIGRTTNADDEVLGDVQDYVEAVMLQRITSASESQAELFRLMRLMKNLGRVLEQAHVDGIEEAFFVFNTALDQHVGCIPGIEFPWRALCMPVDVIDLDRDERECPVCMESFVAKEDEDREEEKPVELPCGHVFGKRCLARHFVQMRVSCPLCNKLFDPDNYLAEIEDVVSPWWMTYIRGEAVA
jgi:hypothetical protein